MTWFGNFFFPSPCDWLLLVFFSSLAFSVFSLNFRVSGHSQNPEAPRCDERPCRMMLWPSHQPTTRRVGSFVHILITLCIPPWNNTTYVIPEQCPSRLTHHAYMRPWVLNSRSAELHTFTRVMAQCESTCGALAGMKEEEESRALFLRPFCYTENGLLAAEAVRRLCLQPSNSN
jgi:hypothetical protein